MVAPEVAPDAAADPPQGSRAWPRTPWSFIREARAAGPAERRAAVARLLELYHVPLRRFFARVLKLDGSADDVAHDLFQKLLEQDLVAGLKQETSLRGFLKVACRRQCGKWREAEAAAQRALPRAGAAPEAAAVDDRRLDAAVDEELRRHYLEEALRRLREDLIRRGKEDLLAIFEARTRLDGSRPDDYATIAARFKVRVYDVQNRLALARKGFRRELLRIAAERSDAPREELRELGLLRFLGQRPCSTRTPPPPPGPPGPPPRP